MCLPKSCRKFDRALAPVNTAIDSGHGGNGTCSQYRNDINNDLTLSSDYFPLVSPRLSDLAKKVEPFLRTVRVCRHDVGKRVDLQGDRRVSPEAILTIDSLLGKADKLSGVAPDAIRSRRTEFAKLSCRVWRDKGFNEGWAREFVESPNTYFPEETADGVTQTKTLRI